jgi:hypothetical protein
VAELAVYGDATTGAAQDLAGVTRGLLLRVNAGLDRRFPPVHPEPFGRRLPARLKARLADAAVATAEKLRSLADAAVAANRVPIERFAARLAEAGELTGTELQSAIAEAGFVRLDPVAEPEDAAAR